MIEIGKNPNTNEPIYFQTESQTGECPHIGIFGGPGFGKSFLLKKEIADFAAHSDTKTFIIGAKPEYQQFAEETNIELCNIFKWRVVPKQLLSDLYAKAYLLSTICN